MAAMNWPGIITELAPKAIPAARQAFQSADSILSDFLINTPQRIALFLAQVMHETGGLTRIEENLNYSPKRLLEVFPKYFPDLAMAMKYAGNAEAIANRVYGARMGNKSAGDGWKYRGRGFFQLTGRDNYEAMGKRAAIPLLIQPELATSSRYLLPLACHFWNSRGMSALADENDLRTITYRVNGGFNGLDDRAAWLVKAKEVMGNA
jgi:putative chitinase